MDVVPLFSGSTVSDEKPAIIYFIYLFFWFQHEVCGILVPQPGIKPGLSSVKAWSLNH